MLYLTKQNPDKNQYRFYKLSLSPTLFGGWSLIREWGRIGSAGTVKIDFFDTEREAVQKQEKLFKQKVKKGYQGLISNGNGYL